MEIKLKTLRKSINKAYLKEVVDRASFNRFKSALKKLLDAIALAEQKEEHEEHFKNFLAPFLKETGFADCYINTSGRIDLAVHDGPKGTDPVGVLIEVKRPSNKAEMITAEHINRKAMHEAVLYYLEQRLEEDNTDLKQVVITNMREWFVFDAQEFERCFYKPPALRKEYKSWKNNRKVSSNNEYMYERIDGFLESNDASLTGTHFSLDNYRESIAAEEQSDKEKKLIPLYKFFTPVQLLKASFANDSNTLNREFYRELLYILGLEEVKDGSTRYIERVGPEERQSGALIENTIRILESEDHLSTVSEPEVRYGAGAEDQLFNVALDLGITWMNRVLFLKLLEAQLYRYHRMDERFKFLNSKLIDEYDELNKLFFQVLAKKEADRPADVNEKFGHIPYLNSSLFDVSKLEHETIRISGLDDKTTMPVYGRSVLREHRGESLATLDYLFRFLDAYDFSAEKGEEIRTERKTLINASVLGLIFEKINGYKDGSFYTPGFITEYMARETLRKAVIDKFVVYFDQSADTSSLKGDEMKMTDIYNVIGRDISIEKANGLVNSVTICDPAVGSGHFLVSCLNELIAIKSELGILCDTEGRRLRGATVTVENDELIVTWGEEELFEYEVAHEWSSGKIVSRKVNAEVQRVQQALFHEKKQLIENSLFGVDINPNSVKICRLRLWIELLKRAYYSPSPQTPFPPAGEGLEGKYRELQTLPNIDINIKQGNSLVSRFDLDSDLSSVFKDSEHSLEDYKEAVRNYKHTGDRAEKHRLQELIDEIKEEYSTTLYNNRPINRKLSKARGKMELMQNADLFGDTKFTKKEVKAQEKKVKKLEEQKAEEESGAFYNQAFEWRFEFPEVLDGEGRFTGFDVLIANPPYGVNLNKEVKDYLKQKYKAVKGNYDVYTAFIELGSKIGKPNSYSSFITPVSWLTGTNFKWLRKYLKNKLQLVRAIILPYDVFPDAYVDTGIYFFKNNQVGKYKSEVFEFHPREKIDQEDIRSINYKKLPSEYWKNERSFEIIFNPSFYELKNKVLQNTEELEKISDSTRGILAKTEDIFEEKRKDTKLLFVGNLYRYTLESEFSWVKYGENLKEKPSEYYFFKGQRILIRRLISRQFRMMAFLVKKEFVNKKDIYNVLLKDDKYCYEYILALINSKLFSYLKVGGSSLATKDDFSQLTLTDIRQLPIKIIDKKEQKKFATCVDQILTAKRDDPDADTTELEAEIDRLVYELYGLTEEEIEIVEESFN